MLFTIAVRRYQCSRSVWPQSLPPTASRAHRAASEEIARSESPAALEAYSTLWGIAEKTGFTPQERNVVYLAIIYENECTYCMAGHTNLSRMAKVDDDTIVGAPPRL